MLQLLVFIGGLQKFGLNAKVRVGVASIRDCVELSLWPLLKRAGRERRNIHHCWSQALPSFPSLALQKKIITVLVTGSWVEVWK